MADIHERYPLLGFGQAVIGPPGSGKSTYVRAMQSMLAKLGRKACIVNLDPAGEDEQGAAVSLKELLGLEELCAVHLVDSHYCTDPAKFISVLCTSLSTMLHVELPHVNVLSKMDLIEQYGRLAFNLDFYTEVMDLSYLVDHLTSDPFFRRHRRLHEKLAEVIQDYGLVTFIPLSIKDDETLKQVLNSVDKATGFCFGETGQNLSNLMSVAVGADFHFASTLAFQEKYVENEPHSVEEEALDE
ncbi:hypothetical protein GDO86_003483 [Hymenochirus boettgeri]|uniref:GPN-loop GTPase 2 n=1 Tax=Hymenochirus boettgeri TaxID=247094 RepID=A0A8T2K9L6_9PIPI|nr:hypothetical protein GDO86_003483 [Hymenochirus boettgeri]